MIGRDEVTDLEGTRVSNMSGIIFSRLAARLAAHRSSGARMFRTRIVSCRIVVTRLYFMYFLS